MEIFLENESVNAHLVAFWGDSEPGPGYKKSSLI